MSTIAWSEGGAKVSAAETDNDGFAVHRVRSPYQAEETLLRVLQPRPTGEAAPRRALYVLPVQSGDGRRWGRPLAHIRSLGLHNRFSLVCVFPTFAHTPWYADHPHDLGVRQESHLLRVVLPAVEALYGVLAAPAGRLLIGFSKSGWGALSLLLRRPDLFARAAAWDAPLTQSQPNRPAMGEVFATELNFRQYEPARLIRRKAARFQARHPRILLGGGSMFASSMRRFAELLDELGVSHVYRPGPGRNHRWDTGWMAELLGLLVRETPGD